MSRVKLQNNHQKLFLNRIGKYFDYDWPKIAKISNICERTLRDWRREKYNMTYKALLKLHKISGMPIPKIIKVLPEHWSAKKFARLGGLRRYQIYGNLGTPEGRRKGGTISQRKFQLDPDYAKRLGFKVRKAIRYPQKSPFLAEFIGALLGDGGITDYQIRITFNRDTDKEYAIFLQKAIKRLFALSPTIIINKDSDKGEDIVIYSKNLVEFLERLAFQRGDKIKNQIDIPDWIFREKDYQIACLRGLVDTDGSFYSYKHKVFNKTYCNFAMCFTNHSKPLLRTVCKILKDMGFNPIINNERIYLHRTKEIDRYFREVGTHNPKHWHKYKSYIAIRNS